MIKLLWTNSKLPLSKFITWGLDEPVSHFAIMFFGRIILHSNVLGFHVVGINSFKKWNDIRIEKELKIGQQNGVDLMLELIEKHDAKGYDFKAFFFFVWRGILRKFFRIKLPSKSSNAGPNEILCTEAANMIPLPRLQEKLKGHDLAIVSPYALYKLVKDL